MMYTWNKQRWGYTINTATSIKPLGYTIYINVHINYVYMRIHKWITLKKHTVQPLYIYIYI